MAAELEAGQFALLVEEAERRWRAIAEGDRPWLRIGTALCGKAAGCDEVIDALEARLQRQKARATVTQVGCFGLCFAEPLLDVQFPGGPRIFYGNVTPESVEEIVDSHVVSGNPVTHLAMGYLPPEDGLGSSPPAGLSDLSSHPMKAWENRIALRNAGDIDPLDIYHYLANGGYGALRKALREMTPGETLEQVNASGLRGRGGAAFPTATKWRFLAGNPSPVKYVLCNCEEGDPGAFNDKAILESDPHTLVEGVIIAGYATGASRGYIFIRHGHDGPIERCRTAVRQAQESGLLGEDILGSGFDFDIEVALTGDSYVAGEETALMEAIEGKRAMPRFRPPFPAQVGLFGKPTNINNGKTSGLRAGDRVPGRGMVRRDRSRTEHRYSDTLSFRRLEVHRNDGSPDGRQFEGRAVQGGRRGPRRTARSSSSKRAAHWAACWAATTWTWYWTSRNSGTPARFSVLEVSLPPTTRPASST